MQIKAKSVQDYLNQLPEERRTALEALRQVILKNLPKGYAEGMQYGMIGYFVPHDIYPKGYHCNPKEPLPFGGIASQKNHMSFYLMCIYGDEHYRERFLAAWAKTGKKLDMGKSCIRFKRIEDLPLDVIGRAVRKVTVKKFVQYYESALDNRSHRKPAKKVKKSSKRKQPKKRS